MTKKIILQKKTINNITTDSVKKSLSIQFSLGGFSFCSFNSVTKEIIHFSTYSFEKVTSNPKELLVEIEKIFNQNNFLNQDFEKVTIIHQNNLSTLVPSPLFDEKEVKTYLDYNVKTLVNDFIAFDSIELLDIKNVYVPYTNINNFFFDHFGEFEYKHHSTVLIEKLISLSKNNNNDRQFYVNVTDKNFDVVVLEGVQLILYNTFSFSSKEDFIYYILFTIEQLHMDTEKLSLIFSGNIEKNSEIYNIAYQYIRNIAFLDVNNTTFENKKNISAHSNIIVTP